MLITLIGLVAVVLFGILGYSRGIYKILAIYGSFLLATLLSKPSSVLIFWMVEMSGMVPMALVPLAGQFLAGLLLFLLFNYWTDRILQNQAEVREQLNQPRMAAWEQPGGAIMGAAWGFFLVIFILTGLHLIGSVEEIMVQSPQPVTKEEGISLQTSQYAEKQKEASPDPALLPQAKFGGVKRQIEYSAFGTLVQKADPVDEKVKAIFNNLNTVVNSSSLFEIFKSHPVIAHFTNNPSIRALSEDSEIQHLIQTGQYYQLLDNARITSLLKDEDLYRDLKNVDLGEILREVIEEGFTR